MHGQTGRFVQHRGKGILKQNAKVHRLGFHLGGRVGRQRKGQLLARRKRHIGVDGRAVGKKAAALVFDRTDQPRRKSLRTQEAVQTAALRAGRDLAGKIQHMRPPALLSDTAMGRAKPTARQCMDRLYHISHLVANQTGALKLAKL